MPTTNIAILILSILDLAVLMAVVHFDRRHYTGVLPAAYKPSSRQFLIQRIYNHFLFSKDGIFLASLIFLSGIIFSISNYASL